MFNIPNQWNQNNNQQVKSANIPYTIALSPDEIRASENMIRFSFTPRIVDVNAANFQISLRVVGNVPAGQTVEISNDFVEILLTASNTPTFDQFYTEVSTSTPAYRNLVAESITYELANNLSFARFYDVYAQGDFIYISAKSTGVVFDFTPTLPTNIIISNTTSGQQKFDYEGYIDYTLYCEIYVGTETFGNTITKSEATLVDTFVLPPIGEQDLFINANNVVSPQVEPVLPVKGDSPSLQWYILDTEQQSHLRPYFVVWGDNFRYSDGGEKKKRVQGVSAVKWCQLAAQNLLNPYSFSPNIWNPKTTTAFSFLTDCPDDKLVTYSSVEFLQCILRKSLANNDSFGLQVTYKFYDGTNYTQNIMGGGYNNLAGNISFDVSPDVINLSGIENFIGKLVDTYEVRVRWQLGNNFYTSMPHRYKMHRVCNETSQNIIWLNEFGAWDSIEFRGEQTKSYTKQSNSFERLLPYQANEAETVSSEVLLNYNTVAISRYGLSTGYIDYEHYIWLNSLLKSTSVYIWDNSLEDFRAIQILDDDFSANTAKKESNLSISYRFTVNDNTIKR